MIVREKATEHYIGNATDAKPLNVAHGSTFLVIETGYLYRFDKVSKIWRREA